MTILTGFPPSKIIDPNIRIGPNDLYQSETTTYVSTAVVYPVIETQCAPVRHPFSSIYHWIPTKPKYQPMNITCEIIEDSDT